MVQRLALEGKQVESDLEEEEVEFRKLSREPCSVEAAVVLGVA